MELHWLGSPQSQQPARVGGKAAQLGRLARRYPVPPGFCLPAQARPGWEAAVRQAYQALSQHCGQPDLPVAVRSSAVDEDGQSASFAGMHESYLNVCGAGALIEAIKRCLASAANERARSYRKAQGLPPASAVAVLVQQFIHADLSCVVFSADPLSGDRSQILINAVWGLGESLVGGEVTPDLYRLKKAGLALVQQQIAPKTQMSIPCQAGTMLVNTPRSLQREAALRPDQVHALGALACLLEKRQGWAVDLECSFHNERLYLLQCRPITALAKPTLTLPAISTKLSKIEGAAHAAIDQPGFSGPPRPHVFANIGTGQGSG